MSMDGETIRAFVAIPVTDDIRTAVDEVQQRLQRERVRMRWVPSTGLHLTLAFLGDIARDRVVAAGQAVGEACAMHPVEFALGVQGIGAFPTARRPRVAWMGITGEIDRLFAIQEEIADALRRTGFTMDSRRFKAHLTIGRARGRIDPMTLAAVIRDVSQLPAVRFYADRVVLFQSVLHPAGARYTRLHEHALARVNNQKHVPSGSFHTGGQ